MNKLSATIITFNEERNIRDCLESIKWVDEIVVLDGESKDKTREICKEYTDKIFGGEWVGYARQKNRAIEKASYDWILSIDADERVIPELREEIQDTLKKEREEKEGYYIPRKNFFLGKWIRHGGWYPDYNLRLFRKDRGRFKEREVHERVELQGKAGYLKHCLEHYTYHSIGDFLERLNHYSTLSAQELYNQEKKGGIFQITFHPLSTFLKMFFLKRGFLDGYHGLALSLLYSFYTLSKYLKLKELYEKKGKKGRNQKDSNN